MLQVLLLRLQMQARFAFLFGSSCFCALPWCQRAVLLLLWLFTLSRYFVSFWVGIANSFVARAELSATIYFAISVICYFANAATIFDCWYLHVAVLLTWCLLLGAISIIASSWCYYNLQMSLLVFTTRAPLFPSFPLTLFWCQLSHGDVQLWKKSLLVAPFVKVRYFPKQLTWQDAPYI